MRHFLLPLLATGLLACGTAYTGAGNPVTPRPADYDQPDPITASLFRSEDSTIDEADIQRILEGEVVLPPQMRIAVLNLAETRRNYGYYFRSESFRRLQERYLDTLRTELNATGRAARIGVLPRLLVDREPNIFSLRESAVRLQADALLVFSAESNTYSDFRLFKRNETKVYATVEALLMDIRTGLIVFSTTVSADARGVRREEDTGTEDFERRLQEEASLRAAGTVARELREFLRD